LLYLFILFTLLAQIPKDKLAKTVGAKVPGPGSKVKRLKSLLERAEEKEAKLAMLKVFRLYKGCRCW
jgi:hypothetical protein